MIVEGKDGFHYGNHRTPLENLNSFEARYTLGQSTHSKDRGKAFTWSVEMIHGRFRATLTTCLSKKVYVEHHRVEARARHLTAEFFFRDPDVQELCKWIPPKPSDIGFKVKLSAEEKRACRAHGAKTCRLRSPGSEKMKCSRFSMGYRTDVWDGDF